MTDTFSKIPFKKYSLVLPQVYDDSITFYELVNKLIYAFNNLAAYSFELSAAYDAETENLTLSLSPIENTEE